MTETGTIPARQGKAIRVPAGASVRVINTHGQQVVDTWAFCAADVTEHMSMEHSRGTMGRIAPKVDDTLLTNRRRPILTLIADTTPGIHDTLIAACDRHRYAQLGVVGHHDNCTDNLAAALQTLGIENAGTPCPLNLFMNIPVASDGTIAFKAPVSRPGQFVTFRVECDAILVFSACPQDIVPVNGDALMPTEAHYAVL